MIAKLSEYYILNIIERDSIARSQQLVSMCLSNYGNYGFRSFSVAAPQLWIALPSDIRACDNISEFKRKLKTYLFRKAFT